ncbi:MAG: aminotransferase class I/II-fold pyridoxal phosphate-dependent enzyme [Alphaproteobacteria bacterium]|nr:aminotransferase class I/II-fold pyridoxal phosphate-dependent enzyme [Alphaproteobacteria bacterium]
MNELDTIPLAVPDLRGNEARYLAECVHDNWVSTAGPRVVEMEKRMSALTGRRHAVATVNGTAGLQLALTAVGLKPGDLAIVPDWTFAASAAAIYHAGGEACFVDVTPESWTLDPDLVREALNTSRRRIAAVIAVHACAHPADMDALSAVCRDFGVPLVEDAAGAIGARYKGRPVGSLGDIAMFSFNGNKTVTAGGGGMVVTDRDDWAKTIRHLSTTARPTPIYEHDAVGYNYRMTNLNAAVGVAQLERLDDMLAAKRAIADRYDAAISGRADLGAMPRANWAESGCWLYSVRTASPEDAVALEARLKTRRIEARTFWRCLSGQGPYAAAPRYLSGYAARCLSGTLVSLPCSSSLSKTQQDRVIDALGAWRGHDLPVS